MRPSQVIVAAATVVVLGVGLAALFSAGGGSTQTKAVTTVEVGVANTSAQSEITIPDVRGETGPQASQAFFALGFQSVYAANITQPGAKPGIVLQQEPLAGSKVTLANTTIHLMIAASSPGSVRYLPHRSGLIAAGHEPPGLLSRNTKIAPVRRL